MYEPICIVSESGAGKSTLIKDCNPETTYVLAATKDSLPFDEFEDMFPVVDDKSKARRNFRSFDTVETLQTLLKGIKEKKPEIDLIIIDDIGHLIMATTQTSEFNNRKSGGDARQRYMDLAVYWKDTFIFNSAKRKELVNPHTQIVFNWHADTAWTPDGKPYVAVKMFGNVIKPAEYFNTMLFLSHQISEDHDGVDRFIYTKPFGTFLQAKSPAGVFKDFKNGVIPIADLDTDPDNFKGLRWLLNRIHKKSTN